MNIEELLEKLKQYPLHYTVEVFHESPELGDTSAEVLDVVHFPTTKVVGIELATIMLPEQYEMSPAS